MLRRNRQGQPFFERFGHGAAMEFNAQRRFPNSQPAKFGQNRSIQNAGGKRYQNELCPFQNVHPLKKTLMIPRLLFSSMLTAAALLVSSALVSAHLGDSEKQLIARYGEPTSSQRDSTTSSTLTFERPGQLVIARFVKGKCVALTTTSIGGAFTGAEVQTILGQSGQGRKWTHPKDGGDVWLRDDGALAYVTPGSVDIVKQGAEGIGNPQETSTPKLDLKPAPPVGVVAPASPAAPAGALPPAITGTQTDPAATGASKPLKFR